MIARKTKEEARVEALLLAFSLFGRKRSKVNRAGALSAENDLDRIWQECCSILSEVVDLSVCLDRDNQCLCLFSVAAIVASAVTEDLSYEKFLVEFAHSLISFPDNRIPPRGKSPAPARRRRPASE